MECKKCRKQISDDSRFCNYCGTEVLKLKACTNEGCPDYGKHILPIEAKFCPRCGEPIKGAGNTGNNIQGHEYVDLGLPSGLKWATCNVGANKPEEYGDYFAWGETYTKEDYSKDTSDTYDIDMDDISGDPDYDVATANWGGNWRMPTYGEMIELVDECTWKWIRQNGVRGMKVTGPNGNSIFLPAAGYCKGTSRNDVGEYGGYWSSTPLESYDKGAYYLYFYSGDHGVDWGYRDYGHTVRPVSE